MDYAIMAVLIAYCLCMYYSGGCLSNGLESNKGGSKYVITKECNGGKFAENKTGHFQLKWASS